MANAQLKETVRVLPAAEHEEITRKSFAEARRRSLENRIWWVQAAWQGSSGNRRCWRWVGWMMGRRVASIVWIKSRGYCVRDVFRDRRVGEFPTLALAQEEAMAAATDVPFAVCDAFAAFTAVDAGNVVELARSESAASVATFSAAASSANAA